MGCQGVCLRRAIRISQSHLLLNFTEYIGHMGVRTSCDAGTPSSKSEPLGRYERRSPAYGRDGLVAFHIVRQRSVQAALVSTDIREHTDSIRFRTSQSASHHCEFRRLTRGSPAQILPRTALQWRRHRLAATCDMARGTLPLRFPRQEWRLARGTRSSCWIHLTLDPRNSSSHRPECLHFSLAASLQPLANHCGLKCSYQNCNPSPTSHHCWMPRCR